MNSLAPPQPPSTPPRPANTPEMPPTPRPTRQRPPPGYYAALQNGQVATLAADVIFQPAKSDLADEHTLTSHFGLAAVEPEVMLQQALNGPDAVEWQEAIDYEISQLERLGTWKVVDSPPGVNLIPCHYVLAMKRGPDGEKLCARLVANNQCQKYGIDYFKTFAPTSNMATIHTVLAMAAQ